MDFAQGANYMNSHKWRKFFAGFPLRKFSKNQSSIFIAEYRLGCSMNANDFSTSLCTFLLQPTVLINEVSIVCVFCKFTQKSINPMKVHKNIFHWPIRYHLSTQNLPNGKIISEPWPTTGHGDKKASSGLQLSDW